MYLAAVVISTVFAAVVITIVMYSIVLVFFKILHYCWKRGKNKDKYVLLQNAIQYNILNYLPIQVWVSLVFCFIVNKLIFHVLNIGIKT